jgi:hypothetical protein
MITYALLKDRPKEFLAATGLRPAEFERLLPAFARQYERRYPADKTMKGQPRRRQRGGGVKGHLSKPEDKLLFILIYEKTYPRPMNGSIG